MTQTAQPLPDRFRDADHVEDVMTMPSPALVADLARVPGDLIILGVGGKMGPTLARLAKRAAPEKRVVGVARFSEKDLREKLESWGIECIAADLLEREQIDRLPKLPNVIFMAGRKFGASERSDLTWAMNGHVPALVAEAFARSRIVSFSTGCVYPYVTAESGGATEDTPAVPPSGIYAASCVAREAMFEFFSHRLGTPGRIIRLNYAIDMRYGVLHDVGMKVYSGRPIDITTGYANVIWQGDANSMILRCLNHCTTPPAPINISGPDTIRIRELAQAFGERFGKKPAFTGSEAPTAWLTNTSLSQRLLGKPDVPLSRMIDWTADWIGRGMQSLGKDTHYDTRDGVF